MLPEPDQRLEDPELIRKQIRGLFEMLEGQPPTPDLMKMVQGLKQKGIATRKACEDYADSITETKIGAALIIGIARAENSIECCNTNQFSRFALTSSSKIWLLITKIVASKAKIILSSNY
jgi:hypothetical protein